MEMEIEMAEILRSLGLNKNESNIFLDLIVHRPSSPLEISKRTHIHRSNVYDSLRTLSERGFIKEIVEDGKKIFKAVHPRKIKEYLIQKGQELDILIPDLISASSDGSGESNIFLSQGVFAFRNAMMDLLKLGQPINTYGLPEGFENVLGKGFLDEFNRKRVKHKILHKYIHCLEKSGIAAASNKHNYLEVRNLSKKYNSLVNTNICGDRVVIVLFGEIISIIEIINQDVANSFQKYFQILWSHAR